MKIGLGGFFIPFIFVYNPVLLLQGGTATETILAVITALFSSVFFAAAMENYLIGRLGLIKQALILASAILLVIPGLLTDVIGAVLAILVIVWQKKIKEKNEELNRPKQLSV